MGRKTQAQKKKSSQAIWIVAGVAVAAAVALIGISLYSPQKDQALSPTAKSDTERGAVKNVKGSPNAKVTLTEWNDYL